MGWSWKLGTIGGIQIKVHATFVLALIWGAFLWGGNSISGIWYGVLLTLVLFGVVLLHELGHSLAARRYGIPVHDIVLLPIGGVARLSRMPDKPAQELVVALAGPAVNLAFLAVRAPAVLLGVVPNLLSGGVAALPDLRTPGLANFAVFLLAINASLLAFNMIPAFPLDGGRVLRALLAMRLPYARATGVAASIGRGLAILFGLYGLLTFNFTLSLIALFIFFGAGAEGQEALYRETLKRLKVTELLDPGAPTIMADAPVHVAYERMLRSPYTALAVLDRDGRFLGTITAAGVQRHWAAGVRGTVEAFIERPGVALDCGDSLDVKRQQMVEAQAWVAPVYCGREFAGLLDLNAVGRLVAMRGSGLGGPTTRGQELSV